LGKKSRPEVRELLEVIGLFAGWGFLMLSEFSGRIDIRHLER
jgi:hypothetical protein